MASTSNNGCLFFSAVRCQNDNLLDWGAVEKQEERRRRRLRLYSGRVEQLGGFLNLRQAEKPFASLVLPLALAAAALVLDCGVHGILVAEQVTPPTQRMNEAIEIVP